MSSSGRKLLSAGLLALYGVVALVGHGLHELFGVHHHHHHHRSVAADSHAVGCHHHHHGGPCSGHHRQEAPSAAGEALDHDHDCKICEFLAQMRGELPQIVDTEFSLQHIAEAILVVPRISSRIPLGVAAPRGPPAFVG
jgi:hypothetical protein